MSVTLFPLIGQWTTYNYYKCDEPDAVNGMLRFEQLEPEMNLANGNWLWFADTLGLPNDMCGTIDFEQMVPLIDRAIELRADCEPNSQMYRYLTSFIELARHCIYHGCGATFG
jgi:hypothetical protein